MLSAVFTWLKEDVNIVVITEWKRRKAKIAIGGYNHVEGSSWLE